MGDFLKITVFLLIIVGGAIWFLSSGSTLFNPAPAEKISVSSNTSKNQSPANSAPAANYNPPANSVNSGQSQQGQQISDSEIPAGYTRGQLSPYFKKIRISSVSPSSFSGYPSQVRIDSNLPKDEKVDITGWKIKSNTGKEMIIPDAVNLYDLSTFLFDSNIIVSGASYVTIYSNASAVSKNLRLNKCIGYLENDYNFVPQLPMNCPSFSRSEIQYLSGQCQQYLFSLGMGASCRLPEVSFYNSLPGNDDGNKCREFLNNISYNSCLKNHRNDLDFYLNDWRIWMNLQGSVFDAQNDAVKLFDKSGLLVDQRVY